MTCSACGTTNAPGTRFCGNCGERLGTPVQTREVRKVVTVLFADVTGSTALGEHLDPESLRRVMRRYFDEMKTAIERHGGTVEKFIGDAVMAVFGIPHLHDDDALRAVRAAVDMRRALHALNEHLQSGPTVRLQARIGINTGEVVATDPSAGQAFAVGDAVNVAARLEQAAAPGEILIGQTTYRLVRDAVVAEPVQALEVKGKASAVHAHLLRDVVAGAEGHKRRHDARLVGRNREARLLRQSFERCKLESACHVFTILGPAGVGKSRLVFEFLSEVAAEADVLRGRCLSYGEGITYWPVAEAVKQAASIVDGDTREVTADKLRRLLADAEQPDAVYAPVAEAIGLESRGSSSAEIFWGIRKLIEHLTQSRPLIIVFDDIHWGEPTFLDLVEYIADWSRDVPLLLVCVARPELLDARPSWGGGKLNATSMLLEPLSRSEAEDLTSNLLGSRAVPPQVIERVTDAAEGNPLFLEEMVAMLIEDGVISRRGDEWAVEKDDSNITVPPTIQALLAARLDRLQAGDREVAERAAVTGTVFSRSAVAELLSEPVRNDLDRHLMALIRKELIRAERSAVGGAETYGFRHILIRDAAYEGIPKELRAQLHEKFARWLEGEASLPAAELEQIVGHHLAEAFRYRRELGSSLDDAAPLASAAATKLAAAATRALDRGDFPGAAELYERAIGLERAVSGTRWPHWVVDHADALYGMGRLGVGVSLLQEAVAAAGAAGDHALALQAEFLLHRFRQSMDPEGTSEAVRRRFEEVLPSLEAAGDDETLATAFGVAAETHAMTATWGQLEELASKAVFHARRSGNRRAEASGLRWVAGAIYRGPTPAREAIARLKSMEAEVEDPTVKPMIYGRLGALLALLGDIPAGRAYVELAAKLWAEYGIDYATAGAAFYSAAVEVAAGDLGAAERELRKSIDAFQAFGDKSFSSTLAAWLAWVLCDQARLKDASAWIERAEEAASSDDAVSQAWSRAARARVLANTGHAGAAVLLAQEAVAIADTTDFPEMRATMREALAETLRAQGNDEQAAAALREAVALYEAKGLITPVEQLRAKFTWFE